MNKTNKTVTKTEVKPIDAAALKKALNVRSNVRAGSLTAVGFGTPAECLGCGRM